MPGRGCGLIDGGRNLNSVAPSFTLVLGNSGVEFTGDAFGMAHVFGGVGSKPRRLGGGGYGVASVRWE
jgi:hypothetical protein